MRTLLRRGVIHSAQAPGATAMLVVDGVVAWLGGEQGADIHAGSAERVVDLGGAFVAPAFVDAHVHHTATGLSLVGAALGGAAGAGVEAAGAGMGGPEDSTRVRSAGVGSARDMLDAVARAPRWDGYLLGHGWDESSWPDPALPEADALDRAAGGAKVYLSRADMHSALVSSAMVAAVPGLAGATGFDPSGRVTGQAHHLVRRHLNDNLPPSLRREAQAAARAQAGAHGIAALHEAGGPDIGGEADFEALRVLAANEPGPALVGYWGSTDLDAVARLGASGAAGDLFIDGSLGSRTAWLREPYCDAPESTGRSYLSSDEVAAHLIACTDRGMQAGFHVIGDAAMDAAATALARAMAVCGREAVRAARHRLEHVSMADAEHIAVMAEAGVVASVQPAFDARWGGVAGTYEQRLGRERLARSHGFAAMVRAGVSLAFGSDSPVTPMRPWAWVRAAMWHHTPASRLSGRAAFTAATRGGWRAARHDDAGVLAVGWPATFAVWDAGEIVVQAPDSRVANWSTDPRSGTPGLPLLEPGTPDPRCLATFLSGRPIHEAPDWQR